MQGWLDLLTENLTKVIIRRFKIKNVSGQDDFAAMNEVVTRRYKRLLNEKLMMPDLVIVDGGLGQVGAADLALEVSWA